MLVIDLVLWSTFIILIALVGFALRLRRRIIALQNEGLPVTLDAIFSRWPPAQEPFQATAARRMQALYVEMDEMARSDPLAVRPLPMTPDQVQVNIRETAKSVAVLAPFIKRYTTESLQLSMRPYVNNAERRSVGAAATTPAALRPLQNFVTSPLMVIQMLISISTHGDGDTRQHIRAILGCKNKQEYNEYVESLAENPIRPSGTQQSSQLQAPPQEVKAKRIPTEDIERAETFLRAIENTIKTLDYCIERKNRIDAVWSVMGSETSNSVSGQRSLGSYFLAIRKRVFSILNVPVRIFKRIHYGVGYWQIGDGDNFENFVLDGKDHLEKEAPASHSHILKFKDFDSLTFWFNVPQDALTSQPKRDISLVGSTRTNVVDEVTPTLAGSFNCKAGRPVVSIEPMVGELRPDFSGHGLAFLATDFVCTLGNQFEPDEGLDSEAEERGLLGELPPRKPDLNHGTQYYVGEFVDAYFNKTTKEYVTLPPTKHVELFYVELAASKSPGWYEPSSVNYGKNVFMCLEIPFCLPHEGFPPGNGPDVIFTLRIVMQTQTSIIDVDHSKLVSLLMDWNNYYYKKPNDKEAKLHPRIPSGVPFRYACTVPKIDFTIPAQNITGVLQLAALTRGSSQWQQNASDSFFARGAANMPSFLAPPPPEAVLKQTVQEGVNQPRPPTQTTEGKQGRQPKDYQIDSRGVLSPAVNNPDQPQAPYKLTLDGIGQMARFAIDPQNIGERDKYMGNAVNVPVCNAFYFGVFCNTYAMQAKTGKCASVPLQFGYVAV